MSLQLQSATATSPPEKKRLIISLEFLNDAWSFHNYIHLLAQKWYFCMWHETAERGLLLWRTSLFGRELREKESLRPEKATKGSTDPRSLSWCASAACNICCVQVAVWSSFVTTAELRINNKSLSKDINWTVTAGHPSTSAGMFWITSRGQGNFSALVSWSHFLH